MALVQIAISVTALANDPTQAGRTEGAGQTAKRNPDLPEADGFNQGCICWLRAQFVTGKFVRSSGALRSHPSGFGPRSVPGQAANPRSCQRASARPPASFPFMLS
jgi:hypothetical protein